MPSNSTRNRSPIPLSYGHNSTPSITTPITQTHDMDALPTASSSRNDLFASDTSSSWSAQNSPRTSSFFDVTNTPDSPLPAPRLSQRSNGSFAPSFAPSPISLSRASSQKRQEKSPASPDQLFSWNQTSSDVKLRLIPTEQYFLGRGRYATVYLASYKRDKGKRRDESWRLCAAKRLASDRESQTMGLREAFFLKRLSVDGRARSLSPLGKGKGDGSVYVVKLLAVVDDTTEKKTHSRSISDTKTSRQRSSTFETGPENSSSISRMVLLLEHAELGTMDSFLRSSPHFVDRHIWEKWARQGSEALAWCHEKGIIHADIKPGNLLITSNIDLRLSDFGSSLLVSAPIVDGVGLGTLPFSPPELLDPNQEFSFPVDIYSFGATLYQAITGREPYRGLRSMEMMHHVRRGDLWDYEEHNRLTRIGEVRAGPYPSAWRDAGLKRGGSLREPEVARPRLLRWSSSESLKPKTADSPGSQIWARWAASKSGGDPIDALLEENGVVPVRESLYEPTPKEPLEPMDSSPYTDGSPVMIFLDGCERVPQSHRDVLKRMLEGNWERRPAALELVKLWRDVQP